MTTKSTKTVLVSGGANGIGKGIAMAFLEKGYKVIIADINYPENDWLTSFAGATFHKTDFSNETEILELFAFIDAKTPGIDILINNVGISRFKPLLELTTNEWDLILNTNLRSAFICSREFARRHSQDTYGRIISISSTRQVMSEPHAEAYAASKGGLVSLTHALAASLQSKHMTVNCISPGWIHTGDDQSLSKGDHEQHFSKRVGNPGDIARLCLFFCEPENDFITGQNFYADGGMTKKMMYEE